MTRSRWSRVAAIVALVMLGVAAAPAKEHAAPGHDWGYEGSHDPKHWSKLNPEYATCGAGKNQSPIDIIGAVSSDLSPIGFDYHPFPLTIVDNGHTIQVKAAPGSTIDVGGERWELQQFHFHKPSEEKIAGVSYPMVAHLVHKNAAGKLAVVAVLLQEGRANPLIQTLWESLPKEKEKEQSVGGVTVDPAALLPAEHGYYTFNGSLTTPPCTEGVTWLVLKSPVEISADEIARFGKIYSHNARPVQPLNGRIIRQSR